MPKKSQKSSQLQIGGRVRHTSLMRWSRARILLIPLILLIVYQPAWLGGILWDDQGHITKPELQSMSGLFRIWFDLGATQQYYPFLHTVFWVEHRLWGDQVLGYHLVNIGLHALSSILLFVLLRALGIPGAWFAAGLFALHPVHVESVAWITELKNTLSGALYLGAALSYIQFHLSRGSRLSKDKGGHTGPPLRVLNGVDLWYPLSLCLFVLALMSKSVTATLPAGPILLSWWKERRFSLQRDLKPLLPFFALGALAGLFTVWVEHSLIGAQGKEFDLNLIERGLLAGKTSLFYLGKLFWPHPLIFIYPRWEIDSSTPLAYAPLLFLLILVTLFWRLRSRSKAPLLSLLFFLATLFPAMGFFNVYPFRFSYVADHFQYLASLGPLVLVSASLFSLPAIRLEVLFKKIIPCSILLALALLSWRQAHAYASAEILYRDTLAKNPECWMAHNNLATILLDQGRFEEAREECLKALEIKEDYPEARNNLAGALFKLGSPVEAIAQCELAIKMKPDYADAHSNLAAVLVHQNRFQEAATHYETALKLNPKDADVCNNYAWLLATCPEESVRNGSLSMELSQKAIALKGSPDPGVMDTLAAGYAETGQFQEAIQWQTRSLEGSPEPMRTDFQRRLDLYRAGQPYRTQRPSASSEPGPIAP